MTDYSTVLVLGARKVGKTSVLSAALNGEVSDLYAGGQRALRSFPPLYPL